MVSSSEVGFPERHLASEQVVIAAPMSFAGSAARIWKLTRIEPAGAWHTVLVVSAVIVIAAAWTLVLAWYVMWGIVLVPYRLIRRGQRKRRRDELQHRETLAAIELLRSTGNR
jgi:uncharacterized membrane-anchored protein